MTVLCVALQNVCALFECDQFDGLGVTVQVIKVAQVIQASIDPLHRSSSFSIISTLAWTQNPYLQLSQRSIKVNSEQHHATVGRVRKAQRKYCTRT